MSNPNIDLISKGSNAWGNDRLGEIYYRKFDSDIFIAITREEQTLRGGIYGIASNPFLRHSNFPQDIEGMEVYQPNEGNDLARGYKFFCIDGAFLSTDEMLGKINILRSNYIDELHTYEQRRGRIEPVFCCECDSQIRFAWKVIAPQLKGWVCPVCDSVNWGELPWPRREEIRERPSLHRNHDHAHLGTAPGISISETPVSDMLNITTTIEQLNVLEESLRTAQRNMGTENVQRLRQEYEQERERWNRQMQQDRNFWSSTSISENELRIEPGLVIPTIDTDSWIQYSGPDGTIRREGMRNDYEQQRQIPTMGTAGSATLLPNSTTSDSFFAQNLLALENVIYNNPTPLMERTWIDDTGETIAEEQSTNAPQAQTNVPQGQERSR